MPKNYLIGIGGTGARVVEAVVHCCAAGLGPDELTVFMVDPDEGNGNLSRTKELVTAYQRARAAFGDRNAPDVRAFGTQLGTPKSFVWGIFEDQNRTLGSYIEHGLAAKSPRPELAEFMEVLFSEQERTRELNEGFRGHPSIGAVVMANAPEDKDPWLTFWSDVDAAGGEHEVRVFLVGSIFGGTGAAGVPTFGAPTMLKRHRRARLDGADGGAGAAGDGAGAGRSKILLGAALVLPYFAVDLAKLPKAGSDMFVTPADFPVATKAALQYYADKYEAKHLAYDEMYLVGDSLPQRVGEFSPGSGQQVNRPHYVELATALAAFDFFALDPAQRPAAGEPRVHVAARESVRVDWRAVPVSRDPGPAGETLRTEFKRRMAAMTVFAYALNTLGLDVLGRAHGDVLDSWYKSHFKFREGRPEDVEKDPRKGRQRVAEVADYGAKFLAWIAALDDEDGRVHLVDRAKLFAGAGTGAKAGAGPGGAPGPLLDRDEHDAAIGGLLRGDAGAQRRFGHFLDVMNEVRIRNAAMPAASQYLNLFYEGALGFVADNWKLTPPRQAGR